MAFGRALCPNLATQTVATISDAKTTFTITLDNPAGASTTAAPVTSTKTLAVASTTEAESTASPSETGMEEPTTSVIAVNGTGPEQFQGDAPEFGPMRLWSMLIGMLMMAAVFAENCACANPRRVLRLCTCQKV